MSRCWLWGQSLYVSTAGKYSKSSRVRCHHYVVVCCPILIHPLGGGHRASWKGGEECSLYSKLGKMPWIVLENFFHTNKPLYNLNNLQCVGHWFVTNPPSVPQLSIFGVIPPPPFPSTTSEMHSPASVCHFVCSYHILPSSVVCYWTDIQQHGIYLNVKVLKILDIKNFYVITGWKAHKALSYQSWLSLQMMRKLVWDLQDWKQSQTFLIFLMMVGI